MSEEELTKDGLLGHLAELRGCLLRCIAALLALTFLFLMPLGGLIPLPGEDSSLAGNIYSMLALPLKKELLPGGGQLVSIGILDPFIVQISTALLAALMIAMPYLWYEVWKFVAPGLYAGEKKLVLPLIASSTALFYIGMLFAYFMVFRVVFGFVSAVAPEGMVWTPDINNFFSFAVTMFIAFGVAFETPVAVYLLVRAGIVDVDTLRRARRYVIVGAFVVAAIFTPPDVISQLLLAVPCWLLFELGLFFAPRKPKE